MVVLGVWENLSEHTADMCVHAESDMTCGGFVACAVVCCLAPLFCCLAVMLLSSGARMIMITCMLSGQQSRAVQSSACITYGVTMVYQSGS